MIDIYIRNYKTQQAGTKAQPITTETLILSLPTTMSVSGLPIQNPKLKVEMGKSESFDFTLERNSPYYQGVFQNKTIFRVVYDGYTVFYGRAITVDTSYRSGNQNVHCEGAFSFLIDAYYKASKEEKRTKISLNTYITNLLENHRWYIADSSRDIWPGEIPGGYSNSIASDQRISEQTEKFGVSSWTDTKSALEDVRGYYGGYFRTRYVREDAETGYGYVVLDWLKDYYRDMTGEGCQQIELKKNLIDYSVRTEISNLFTAIIPVGKDGLTLAGYNGSGKSDVIWRDANHDANGNGNWIVAPAICAIYDDNALNSGYHHAEDYHEALDVYGWVYKTVSFSNAGTKSKLFSEAVAWIKNNYYPYVDTYTFKAIDLRMIGQANDAILVGDKRVFGYPNSDGTVTRNRILTVISADYDLYHLENTSYKVGVPAELLTKMWNVKSGKKTTGNITDKPPSGDDKEHTESDSYSDWLGEIIGFLITHNVPTTSQAYYDPGILGEGGYLYDAFNNTWTYVPEVTYEELRVRGLITWIRDNEDPDDSEEWVRIIDGYDEQTNEMRQYIEYLKEKLIDADLLKEDLSQIWNPNTHTWTALSKFSISVVENLGLFDYYKEVYGIDLRLQTYVYAVDGEVPNADDPTKTDKTVNFFAPAFKMVEDAGGIIRDKIDKVKLFMVNLSSKLLVYYDEDGNPHVAINEHDVEQLDTKFETKWVHTDTKVGQVIEKTYTTDANGNIVTIDAAKLMLSVDPQTNKTLAEVMADNIEINATNQVRLGLVKNGDITAGLIVQRLHDGASASDKTTLAQLIADDIQITANQIAQFGVKVGENVTAGLIVQKLDDATDSDKTTLARLFADKISITANQVADFGATAKNAAGELVTAQFIASVINGQSTATIDAKNLNLTNTDVINLINANGEVKINAGKVNLDGYLLTNGLGAAIANLQSVSANGIIVEDGGLSVKMGTGVYGSFRDVYNNDLTHVQIVANPNNANQYLLQWKSRLLDTWQTASTFSKAGSVTISGAWDVGMSGVFTVSPTVQGSANVVTTSLTNLLGTNWWHWGDPNNNEDPNVYYGTIGAAIGSATPTGVFPYQVNAQARYDAGWNNVDFTSISWGTPVQSGSTVYVVETIGMDPLTNGTARNITTHLYLVPENWSSGSMNVLLRSGSANGQTRETLAISLPSTAAFSYYYDSSNNIYRTTATIGGKAYNDNSLIPTDAYNAGSASVGIGGLTWLTGNTTSDTREVQTSTDQRVNASGVSDEKTYTYEFSLVESVAAAVTNGYNAVDLMIDNLSTTSSAVRRMRISHGQFNKGWAAAYSMNGLPSAYSTNSYMTVSMPSSTPGTALSRRYILSIDSSYAYLQYLRDSDNTYVTVCRIANPGSGSSTNFNNGWTAAYNQITLPTTASTAHKYIDILTPQSTPGTYPPNTSRYTLSADAAYVYLKYGDVVVARGDNDGYDAIYRAGFQEGWERCLNSSYSYWWAGEETISGATWWDVCIPKTSAWIYAIEGSSAYEAAKADDWENVGEYWGRACHQISGGSSTIPASNLSVDGVTRITRNWEAWQETYHPTELSNLRNLLKNNSTGYVVFYVSGQGVSGQKYYFMQC